MTQPTSALPREDISWGSHPATGAARRADIDTLRAVACIALVFYHVVGSTPQSGLELPWEHWLHRLSACLIDIRMPLFSFLSGWVFLVIRAQEPGWVTARVGSKVRRLLLPMVTVGTVFWLTRAVMGIPQEPLWEIYLFPYAHYWYLQATFLIMLSFIVLIRLSGGRDLAAAAVLLVAGYGCWLLLPGPPTHVFSLGGAIRLSGFFAAGYLAGRLWPQIDLWIPVHRQRIIGGTVLICALGAGIALSLGQWRPDPEMRRPIGWLIGLSSCLALAALRPDSAQMAWLGRRSYAIYLFHVFFTAGTLLVLTWLWPGLPAGLLWPVLLIAGLFGPIVLEALILRSATASLLCLGIRRRKPA